mmetsp:Transcript_18219/g.23567  ORF Transcript_18219/g.23567 Transcript_18219/m.23567 type:complete len:1047 (-) Transcript_18219:239-3379(-)
MEMKNINNHLMVDAIHHPNALQQFKMDSKARQEIRRRSSNEELRKMSIKSPKSKSPDFRANESAKKALDLMMKKKRLDEVDLAKSMVEKWQKKTEEKVQIRKKEDQIFRPLDPFIQKWNMANVIVMMYILVDVPIRIVFEIDVYLPHPGAIVSLLVDFFFFLDIAITFRTAYVDNQELVVDTRKIAIRYLKSWFMLDLITSIPVEPILSAFKIGGAILSVPKLIRMIKAIRILKIFRLMKLMKAMSDWERKDSMSLTLSRFLKFVVLVFLIAHISACSWMATTILERHPNGEYSEKSWIVVEAMEDEPKDVLYLICLYWAFTTLTTVGYGDLVPGNRTEYLLGITVMIVGSSLFGYIIGNIASLVTHEDDTAILIKDKIRSVSAYMRYRNLPEEMQSKIRHHYEYSWKQTQVYDEEQILSELPPTIRTEVALCIHKETINQVSFLQDMEHDVVPLVVTKLRPVLAPPQETIIREGFVGREMYLCMAGLLESYIGGKDLDGFSSGLSQELSVKKIRPGHEFAEYTLIMDVVKHPTSVKSLAFCDLFVLQKADFDEIGTLFPHMVKNIRKMGIKRFKSQLDTLRTLQGTVTMDEDSYVLSNDLQKTSCQRRLSFKMKRGSLTSPMESARDTGNTLNLKLKALGSRFLDNKNEECKALSSRGDRNGSVDSKSQSNRLVEEDGSSTVRSKNGGKGRKRRSSLIGIPPLKGKSTDENEDVEKMKVKTGFAVAAWKYHKNASNVEKRNFRSTSSIASEQEDKERERKLAKIFAHAFSRRKKWTSPDDFTPAMRNKLSLWKSRAQMALAIKDLERSMEAASPMHLHNRGMHHHAHSRGYSQRSMSASGRRSPAPSPSVSSVCASPANSEGEAGAFDVLLQLDALELRMDKMQQQNKENFGKIEGMLKQLIASKASSGYPSQSRVEKVQENNRSMSINSLEERPQKRGSAPEIECSIGKDTDLDNSGQLWTEESKPNLVSTFNYSHLQHRHSDASIEHLILPSASPKSQRASTSTKPLGGVHKLSKSSILPIASQTGSSSEEPLLSDRGSNAWH